MSKVGWLESEVRRLETERLRLTEQRDEARQIVGAITSALRAETPDPEALVRYVMVVPPNERALDLLDYAWALEGMWTATEPPKP